MTLSPSSLTFTDNKNAQTATLTNNGSSPLVIGPISLDYSRFTQTSNCGSSLAAGTSCTIAVGAIGISGTGVLTVVDNAAAGPQTMNLSYTGTPSNISDTFGHVAIGARSTLAVLLGVPINKNLTGGTITGSSDFSIASVGDCNGHQTAPSTVRVLCKLSRPLRWGEESATLVVPRGRECLALPAQAILPG